jgi:hypothetical protein
VYSFSLDANPGWTAQGQWQFGHPTGGGTHNHDPVAGHTGSNVYGYNLAGDYTNSMPVYYLTTAAINCANLTQTELRFWRWLGVESATFDHATVRVSNNASTWVTVWQHTGAALSDNAWTQKVFDISAVADGQSTVFIRWGMGSTDSSDTYPGWNIDDVEIWALADCDLFAPTGVTATPNAICAGESSRLCGSVPAGKVIDWYTGSCLAGALVGTGNCIDVSPAATTQYFARSRDATTGCMSTECDDVWVTVLDPIVLSDPPNCAIDARQPHLPGNPAALQGWNSVAITFDSGCDVSGTTIGDFTVSCNPVGPPCPTITGVTPVGQTVTVQLSGVIPAGKWTCITHTASGERDCIGSLPADVNSDCTAAPVDILHLIDNLNGIRVPSLTIWQCDIDRSNLCAPADIIALIDLLNGGWNGRTLPRTSPGGECCPSAAP